jgi:tetrapyrrole methylase family protein/MazG family protein
LEETYELLDAMESGSIADHVEELGDVLLQVVFQCVVREEEGAFTLDDVASAVADKMVRRHPHVFGDVKVDNVAGVLNNWEAIKGQEKKDKPDRSALDGVPAALPALLKAQRTQAKASRVGFDWKDSSGAIDKIDEELSEVKEAILAGDKKHIEEEIGDLLFAVVNSCRFLEVQAEDALQGATSKFSRRFRAVEKTVREQGRNMKEMSLSELDEVWDAVKKAEAARSGS